jgi:hypothetical protein
MFFASLAQALGEVKKLQYLSSLLTLTLARNSSMSVLGLVMANWDYVKI